jgi:hypothetical protein
MELPSFCFTDILVSLLRLYRYLSVIIKAVEVWLLGELTLKLIHMLS